MWSSCQSVGFAESFKPIAAIITHDRAIAAAITTMTDKNSTDSQRISAYKQIQAVCSDSRSFCFNLSQLGNIQAQSDAFMKSITLADDIMKDGKQVTLYDMANAKSDDTFLRTISKWVSNPGNVNRSASSIGDINADTLNSNINGIPNEDGKSTEFTDPVTGNHYKITLHIAKKDLPGVIRHYTIYEACHPEQFEFSEKTYSICMVARGSDVDALGKGVSTALTSASSASLEALQKVHTLF